MPLSPYPSPANVPSLAPQVEPTAPPQTPQLYLDHNMNQIERQYATRQNELISQLRAKRITRDQYVAAIEQGTKELNEFYQDYDMRKGTVQRIQQMVDLGLIADPERAQRALWTTVLPPDAARILFPEERAAEKPSPFGRGDLEYAKEKVADYAFRPGEEEFVRGKPSATQLLLKPIRKWGPQIPTKQALIKNYLAWRDRFGYDDSYTTPAQRRQLDKMWDEWMDEANIFGVTEGTGKDAKTIKTRAFEKWDSEDPDIQALRGGRLVSAYNGVDRTPMRVGDRPNPLQQSIAKEMPKPKADGKVMVVSPDGRKGLIPAAQLRDALAAGYTRAQ